MELSDFLKCEKVRCVDDRNRHDLTKGKIYDVVDTDSKHIKVIDDTNSTWWFEKHQFEPVANQSWRGYFLACTVG